MGVRTWKELTPGERTTLEQIQRGAMVVDKDTAGRLAEYGLVELKVDRFAITERGRAVLRHKMA
jgi:hypothetical protein